MVFLCYNKGTKERKQQKKLLSFKKRKEYSNAQVSEKKFGSRIARTGVRTHRETGEEVTFPKIHIEGGMTIC